MKLLRYEKRIVRLAHKLGNRRIRIQAVEQNPELTRWDVAGPIFEVSTSRVSAYMEPSPRRKGKQELTADDLMRLNAARGVSLHNAFEHQPDVTRQGLKPSVTNYNLAVKLGILTGAPILPIGK